MIRGGMEEERSNYSPVRNHGCPAPCVFCKGREGSTADAGLAATLLRLQCWTEHKRVEKLRYMHRNPVKRGLVQEPEQWPWSTFRYYQYGETRLVRVNDCDLMRMSVSKPAV